MDQAVDLSTVLIALCGGLVPALFWLWFWLREDSVKPEPLKMLVLAFLCGMAVVPLALPMQHLALDVYRGNNLILVWVIIEEVLKYGIAVGVVLWHKAVDEPIDLIVYMICIALGFAALENALYIFAPLQNGDVASAVLMSKFRFLGATLLHILASGVLGAFLALAFYRSNVTKFFFSLLGLLSAVLIHTFFNLVLLGASGSVMLFVFAFVWLGITALLILFEQVKLIETKHNRTEV